MKRGERDTWSYSLPIKGRALNFESKDLGVSLEFPGNFSDGSRKRGIGWQAQTRFGSSPRLPNWRDVDASLQFVRKPFDLQTLPVNVFGQRLVFSRLTVRRNEVHATVSTSF